MTPFLKQLWCGLRGRKGIYVILTKDLNQCHCCSGFGVFDCNLKLIPCSLCKSVHPEYFGMQYIKEYDNFRMILKLKPLTTGKK